MPQTATHGPRGKITTRYKLSQNINSPARRIQTSLLWSSF